MATASKMFDDSYNDYYAVFEQTTPIDSKIEILKCQDKDSDTLHYIRFYCCLQAFFGRNRNGRLWKGQFVKTMSEAPEVQELLRAKSFCGEAGHPLPTSDKEYSLKRICTIDPLRVSHVITQLDWKGLDQLFGVVETLDEGHGSPGRRFMMNIQQGMEPAMSLRSLVPQRKNADGTIDVIGPGRMICYDRVYLPAHKEAYISKEIPVKQITKKTDFEQVMESFTTYMTSHSEKIKRVTDGLEVAMESTCFDSDSGMMSIKTDEGRIFVSPELKYRNEIRNLSLLYRNR